MSDPRSSLDDPAGAAFAWARFRRIMRWMVLATAIIVALSLVWMDAAFGPLSWVTIIATAVGFGATILLTAGLMGLMFLSSGTGHDDAVDDFVKDEKDRHHR
ncbi:MAG: hypothetical protein ACTHMG_04055 [Sphingomonas sp.]